MKKELKFFKWQFWGPFILFVVQWILWGMWQMWVMPDLPAGVVTTLIDSVLIKALVWVFPVAAILLIQKRKQIVSDFFMQPFPWLACVILLCLTTAFLYTVRVVRGLLDTHVIFDPMILVFSLSAGLFEEISFRGGLFHLQETAVGFLPAALINGVLFTLYHYPGLLFGESFTVLLSFRTLLIFIMGVVFCLMFHKWRNLALNMTVHTVWDILTFLFCLTG